MGDHVGLHEDGDLVLLGANLPHTWASTSKVRQDEPTLVVVVWLRPDWLMALLQTLPELAGLEPLFRDAARGIAFSPATAAKAAPAIRAMPGAALPDRTLKLLEVLVLLSRDREMRLLASPTAAPVLPAPADRPSIEHVLNHIRQSASNRAGLLAAGKLRPADRPCRRVCGLPKSLALQPQVPRVEATDAQAVPGCV